MKRRLVFGCTLLAVVCLGLTIIGALGQALNLLPDSTEQTQTAAARNLPTRIAAANATRYVELTAIANTTPSLEASPQSTITPAATNTLTDAEWVEFGFATSEAYGLPLRSIFESINGVTHVDRLYVTFWSADQVSVEAYLDAPQSIVNRLFVEAQAYVPEMTIMYLTITSPDEQRIYYVWELANPFWRPLDMSNGELLPTFAPQ